jgi:hypothetical protein
MRWTRSSLRLWKNGMIWFPSSRTGRGSDLAVATISGQWMLKNGQARNQPTDPPNTASFSFPHWTEFGFEGPLHYLQGIIFTKLNGASVWFYCSYGHPVFLLPVSNCSRSLFAVVISPNYTARRTFLGRPHREISSLVESWISKELVARSLSVMGVGEFPITSWERVILRIVRKSQTIAWLSEFGIEGYSAKPHRIIQYRQIQWLNINFTLNHKTCDS